MKKVSILVVFFCISLFTYKNFCFAQKEAAVGNLELFVQANVAYKEAKYDEAVAGYEGILAKGVENGNIYYNLGNSYFKKGLLGKALLNYERAMFFMPNDNDLRSNYEYLSMLLNLDWQQAQGSRFFRLIDKLFTGVNCNFMAIVLSVSYTVFILLIILWLINPQRRKLYKVFAFFILMIFTLTIFAFNRKLEYFNNSVVIISKEAEARFGPLKDATVFFTLTEGSHVKALEQTFDWIKIRRFDGKEGWVVKSQTQSIF